MKKWIALLLAALMIFTLAACEEAAELVLEVLEETEPAAETGEPTTEPQEQILTEEPTEASTEAVTEEITESTEEVLVSEENEPQTLIVMTEPQLDENGTYTSKEDVALYIHLYGRLPKNFITKAEARKLGWEGGSLEPYAPGMCIGGDRFGNYEELLPTDRSYFECDIDTLGARSRGAKRIVFSDDGLIYYTDDHYETFELLYGEP